MSRPSPEEIFEKSREILMIRESPGFTTFCNDIYFLASEDNPEPKKFFDQVRGNYPGWQRPDFAALFFIITGEPVNEQQ